MVFDTIFCLGDFLPFSDSAVRRPFLFVVMRMFFAFHVCHSRSEGLIDCVQMISLVLLLVPTVHACAHVGTYLPR